MKRFTGHQETWGTFVDAKMNAPDILKKEVEKSGKGSVILSSVTDPYQPVEARYELTRKCLEVLLGSDCSVDILTKSPLVLRDLSLIRKFRDIEVGITITTDDENMRKAFEPGAPPVMTRIRTLRKLHEKGIRTYAFIGPLLPMNPERLAEQIKSYAGYVFIDRMNYLSKTRGIYRNLGLDKWLDRGYVDTVKTRLRKGMKDIHGQQDLFDCMQ
jgi:DNA repair photolyase